MLWSLVQILFKSKIDALITQWVHKELAHERAAQYERERDRHNIALKTNYPIGTVVIVRSNEPGPYTVAEVVGYIQVTKSKELCLDLVDKKTGKEFITFSDTPMYWSEELEKALSKLEWNEQWNIYANGKCIIGESEKLRKEAYTSDKTNP
jgi:hypothetical protein